MDLRENQMMKKFNDVLGRFGTEHECDIRTDGRTEWYSSTFV